MQSSSVIPVKSTDYQVLLDDLLAKNLEGDLFYRLRHDPELMEYVEETNNRILSLDSNPSFETLREILYGIYSKCGYNSALLAPILFPEYPKNNPFSLVDRPFQIPMIDLVVGTSTTIVGSRQIGKSTVLAYGIIVESAMLPGWRTLYIVPHLEHTRTFHNKLAEMERAFAYLQRPKGHRLNLDYKEYADDSIAEIIRVLTDAGASRGKTADRLIYDEVQLFDPDLEYEVEQAQSESETPVTVYAGTSTTVDTMLQAKWDASSQGAWILFCGCGARIDTSDVNQARSIIKATGPKCPKCSRDLDVLSGDYVHKYMEAYTLGRRGLHVPKIIIPDYAYNPVRWGQLYNQFLSYSPNQFSQEVLGIAVEEGAKEISRKDLEAMCVLPETPHALENMAMSGKKYRFVVSGCDWGGSDYKLDQRVKTSYTVHVVLGVLPNGDIDVIHMKKYGGMLYREIAWQIAEMHVRLKGDLILTDFGAGAAYNMLLREHPRLSRDRHFIMCYGAASASIITRPDGESLPNQLSLNRTESITQLFEAIKRTRNVKKKTDDGEDIEEQVPNPRLRSYNWPEASGCLSDILNMYRIISENQAGRKAFRYRRHGSKPDDILHGMNFAYVGARILLGEKLFEDPALEREIFKKIGRQSIAGGRFGYAAG